MTRYRKSIHTALQEVAEWEAPKEPEVIVEEAPIPTETGRELLKKRIAHQKIEKKELKYYPMGNVFKDKLQKTTEHLKEALELDDELDEAVKWEVKVSNLPVFYADGKSKGAVRQMLRKMLKRPDDILSITRTTSAALKKIRRAQIAGDDPGEDEDKDPVGPSEAFEGPFSAPGSGSIAKPRKSKASDVEKSIEDQMADARKESLAFQEGEWDSMWKNAAKSKPKMSFKQATAFVDEVGLDKKEKTNALKTAKKWLK